MHFSRLATTLAVAGLSTAAAVPVDDYAAVAVQEKAIARGPASSWEPSGRYFGTALTIRNDAVESYIIQGPDDFSSITPENSMKWDATEPSNNTFTFAGGDAIVNYTNTYGKELRCHNLVWHSQLPNWVSQGGFDNATLIGVMENHIKNLAGRWGSNCTYWDVVNEALEEDGSYRKSVWYNTIGEAYLPMAFAMAKKYTPHSKLYYNDYNIEQGAKAEGARRIVNLIKSYGVHIDGVGIQAHLTSEGTASSGGSVAPNLKTITATLKGFTDLDVDVSFTELDVRFNLPVTDKKLKVQADVYRRFTRACNQNRRCVGITVWGVSDKYSWIPGVFAGEGAALLYDEKFAKKPAYYAVLNYLGNHGK